MLGLALVALLAFGALSAGAASAADAPRWTVKGAFLGAGASKAFTTTSTAEVVLAFGGFKLSSPAGECTEAGEIEGSAAGTPGTKKNAVLTCKKVKVTRLNGEAQPNCTVKTPGAEVGTIKTNSLKSTLVWLNQTGGAAGDLLEPTSGTTWATIEILGAACAASQTANITGKAINQFLPVEEEAETAQLAFPSTAILNYYDNEASRVKQTISQLKLGAVTSTLSGNYAFSLSSKEKVGVSPTVPTVATEAASGVKFNGATLNASVNPHGLATTYQYEYGTTEVYGSKVPAAPKSAGEGMGSVKVPEALKGQLAESTTYHYRIVATNSSGTSKGADKTFTTSAFEAPRWKVNGAFLGAGATKSFTAVNTASLSLKLPSFTLKMPTCSEAGKLTGSAAKEPGGKKEVILTCTGVTVEGHPECTIRSSGQPAGTIVSNSLKSTLARTSGGEGWAHIGEVMQAEVGTAWLTPEIVGATCAFQQTSSLTGQLIGEVSETEKQLKALDALFPEVSLPSYWDSGVSPKCEEKYVSAVSGFCERPITPLKFGASLSTLSGSLSSSLTSEELFGISMG